MTTIGKNIVRDWLASQVKSGTDTCKVSSPNAIGVGEGSGAAAVGDTALDAEWTSGSSKRTFDYASGISARVVEYESYWDSVKVSGLELREIGVFNQTGEAAGSLFARVVLPSTQTFQGNTELLIDYQLEVV